MAKTYKFPTIYHGSEGGHVRTVQSILIGYEVHKVRLML